MERTGKVNKVWFFFKPNFLYLLFLFEYINSGFVIIIINISNIKNFILSNNGLENIIYNNKRESLNLNSS